MTLLETPLGALGNVRIDSDTAPENLLTGPAVLRLTEKGGHSALFLGIAPVEAKRLATLCYWLHENADTRAGREVIEYVGEMNWEGMGERLERVAEPQFKS